LGAGLRMGKDSALDAYSFVGIAGQITIGDNVIMGQHVSFHSESHNYSRTDLPIKLQGTRRTGIVIEDDCWVGSNTTFLDGCYVEKGCVIGAGSIVRGRIPAYSVAVGAPAHVVRSRVSGENASS
jgi:acetyltransferase-like isoleucine patch superfamily enzyme